MEKSYMRVYQELTLQDIEEHMLILGDLAADCSKCRALGLATDVSECPECGTKFKYLTSRRIENHPGERYQIVKRAKGNHPNLIFIDYGDYQKIMGKKKARDFFGAPD